MVATPEAKIKARVKAVLARYQGIYYEMPVPSGYGNTTLDFVGCWRGRFFAIETKAGGKKPTAKQKIIMERMAAAGGAVFYINDDLMTIISLVTWLNGATNDDPNLKTE